MKNLKSFVFTLANIFTLASAFANDGCCDPRITTSSSTCFIDNISIAADFLWWKPCIDEMDYATATCETDEKITIKYKGLCPDFHSGVRVILGRPSFYCDWGFIASYNYFKSTAHHGFDDYNKISSPLIHPGATSCITELFDGVRASSKVFYNEWDALITYDMSCCNPCHLFQPFVGVAGLNLKQNFNVDMIQGLHTDTIRWRSDYWGVGLRAGIEYQYLFCDRFRFFTLFHGTMLAGDADTKACQSFCRDVEIKEDECCHFIPGYHIGVGLIYEGCFCRIDYSLRLGYEFLEWRNLPTQRIFIGEEETLEQGRSTPTNTRAMGFHGLMAGIGMTF